MAVAGIIASLGLTEKKRLADNTFVFLGAGEVYLHHAYLRPSGTKRC